MTFKEKVYKIVQRIPKGQVLTYGEVARLAGSAGAARAVGNIMKNNERPNEVPCHRVVRSDGKVGGYNHPRGSKKKLEILKKEGVI